MRYLQLLVFLVSTLGAMVNSQATDAKLEAKWQRLVSGQLIDASLVWLQTPERKFYAVYADAGNRNTAVILMHGMRRHANWESVIEPLRLALKDKDVSVLSLQLPVLGHDTGMRDHAVLLNESPPRIDAEIGFLKQKNFKRIILVGHGLGAIMGTAYLVEKVQQDVAGLVAIGLYMLNYTDERMWTPNLLRKLRLPILDVYGENDQFAVEVGSKVRKEAAAAAGNKAYQQLRINHAV